MQLNDSDLTTIFRAAGPLDPSSRNAFLEFVISELNLLDEIGPGVVYRTVREVQKKYWDPPLDDARALVGPRHNKKRVGTGVP